MITHSEKEILDQLRIKLTDRKWRLSNLYHIKDENGQDRIFKPNAIQQEIIDNLWYFNVIPKARQHGITTLFCILWLDEALFSFMDCAIIAHRREDAEKIFDHKIKYAWDRLPQFLKDQYVLDADNARMLKFKCGNKEATIAVSTSFRSATIQRLHISEMGPIDFKYPEKAEEIKTGALNAIHKGQIVVMESTAKGQFGVFFDTCKKAEDTKLSGKQLTEMDWKLFFFPWYLKPEYQLSGDVVIDEEMKNYFESLENIGIHLTKEQKNWYIKKRESQKDSMYCEYPSTLEEAFRANVEGCYYGKLIDDARLNKRITYVPYDPKLPVDTWWDLGFNDDTTIIFTQTYGMEVRVIDYYANHGESMLHYAQVLKDKGYFYGAHWGPHDLEVHELTTGRTRKDYAMSLPKGLAIYFQVMEKLPIQDGIDAVRNILPHCWFDEQKCSTLIKHLAEYRKEWDDKLGTFKDKPLHNYASHSADAFRILGLGMKHIGGIRKQDPELMEEYQRRQDSETFDRFNSVGII